MKAKNSCSTTYSGPLVTDKIKFENCGIKKYGIDNNIKTDLSKEEKACIEKFNNLKRIYEKNYNDNFCKITQKFKQPKPSTKPLTKVEEIRRYVAELKNKIEYAELGLQSAESEDNNNKEWEKHAKNLIAYNNYCIENYKTWEINYRSKQEPEEEEEEENSNLLGKKQERESNSSLKEEVDKIIANTKEPEICSISTVGILANEMSLGLFPENRIIVKHNPTKLIFCRECKRGFCCKGNREICNKCFKKSSRKYCLPCDSFYSDRTLHTCKADEWVNDPNLERPSQKRVKCSLCHKSTTIKYMPVHLESCLTKQAGYINDDRLVGICGDRCLHPCLLKPHVFKIQGKQYTTRHVCKQDNRGKIECDKCKYFFDQIKFNEHKCYPKKTLIIQKGIQKSFKKIKREFCKYCSRFINSSKRMKHFNKCIYLRIYFHSKKILSDNYEKAKEILLSEIKCRKEKILLTVNENKKLTPDQEKLITEESYKLISHLANLKKIITTPQDSYLPFNPEINEFVVELEKKLEANANDIEVKYDLEIAKIQLNRQKLANNKSMYNIYIKENTQQKTKQIEEFINSHRKKHKRPFTLKPQYTKNQHYLNNLFNNHAELFESNRSLRLLNSIIEDLNSGEFNPRYLYALMKNDWCEFTKCTTRDDIMEVLVNEKMITYDTPEVRERIRQYKIHNLIKEKIPNYYNMKFLEDKIRSQNQLDLNLLQKKDYFYFADKVFNNEHIILKELAQTPDYVEYSRNVIKLIKNNFNYISKQVHADILKQRETYYEEILYEYIDNPQKNYFKLWKYDPEIIKLKNKTSRYVLPIKAKPVISKTRENILIIQKDKNLTSHEKYSRGKIEIYKMLEEIGKIKTTTKERQEQEKLDKMFQNKQYPSAFDEIEEKYTAEEITLALSKFGITLDFAIKMIDGNITSLPELINRFRKLEQIELLKNEIQPLIIKKKYQSNIQKTIPSSQSIPMLSKIIKGEYDDYSSDDMDIDDSDDEILVPRTPEKNKKIQSFQTCSTTYRDPTYNTDVKQDSSDPDKFTYYTEDFINLQSTLEENYLLTAKKIIDNTSSPIGAEWLLQYVMDIKQRDITTLYNQINNCNISPEDIFRTLNLIKKVQKQISDMLISQQEYHDKKELEKKLTEQNKKPMFATVKKLIFI